jgi:UDP:flavonoid glycosyltransferase YjiC (YdhE family)
MVKRGSSRPLRPVSRSIRTYIVLSIGDQLEPEQIGPVPRNTIIVKRTPQLELLKLASVCITYSGLNTVHSLGVPRKTRPRRQMELV